MCPGTGHRTVNAHRRTDLASGRPRARRRVDRRPLSQLSLLLTLNLLRNHFNPLSKPTSTYAAAPSL